MADVHVQARAFAHGRPADQAVAGSPLHNIVHGGATYPGDPCGEIRPVVRGESSMLEVLSTACGRSAHPEVSHAEASVAPGAARREVAEFANRVKSRINAYQGDLEGDAIICPNLVYNAHTRTHTRKPPRVGTSTRKTACEIRAHAKHKKLGGRAGSRGRRRGRPRENTKR